MPTITLKDVCERYGVTRMTVQQWAARGAPCTRQKRKGGGRPLLLFHVEQLDSWVAGNTNITKRRQAVASAKAEDTQKPPTPPAPGNIDMALAQQPGFLGSVERLKINEYKTAQQVIALKSAGRVADANALSARYASEVKELRESEFALVEYRKAMGQLADSVEMARIWKTAMVTIRNNVMSVGHRVAPGAQALLKSADLLPELVKKIEDACRDALRQSTAELSNLDALGSRGGADPATANDSPSVGGARADSAQARKQHNRGDA